MVKPMVLYPNVWNFYLLLKNYASMPQTMKITVTIVYYSSF